MIKVFTIIAALLFATSAQSEPKADLVIEGVIGQSMGIASRTVKSLITTQDTINIVIDSPGGSVIAGWDFIRTLKQAQTAGVTINCYVSGMATSMAFQILSFCDGKFTEAYSFLLWHPVRMGSRNGFTPRRARAAARMLRETEVQLLKELQENLTVDKKYFLHHYHEETLHLGEMLRENIKDIEIVDKVPVVTSATKVAKENGMFFRNYFLNYMHPTAFKLYFGHAQ